MEKIYQELKETRQKILRENPKIIIYLDVMDDGTGCPKKHGNSVTNWKSFLL